MRSQVDEFHRCQDCTQIYWKGSHYERLQQFVNKVIDLGKGQ
ncbi:MAG: Mut7-C RNAse domain-containing protein [Desmonostoc vinosum HA7617-LM4]|nr:Mut7-C RNAse domain-containing protein [Desmonostoc vinosum HA7617-LM4]